MWTLQVACPDRPGLVAAVAGVVAQHGGNILDSDQHTDPIEHSFHERLRFQLPADAGPAQMLSLAQLQPSSPVAPLVSVAPPVEPPPGVPVEPPPSLVVAPSVVPPGSPEVVGAPLGSLVSPPVGEVVIGPPLESWPPVVASPPVVSIGGSPNS